MNQFEIWIADLNPKIGTEPGKVRPVVIVQTDKLNEIHPSIIICPLTTNIIIKSSVLRVNLSKGDGNLNEECDVLIDQVRSIDKKRLIKVIGKISQAKSEKIKANLRIVMDLD